MLGFWTESDLKELQDPILIAQAQDEMEYLEEEFAMIMDVVQQNQDCVNPEDFTLERFIEAHTLVVTRCFGYSLPSLFLVPLADCANHHTTDNQYELFNSRLDKLKQKKEEAIGEERHYFTQDKGRINFHKHFSEDSHSDSSDLPYKSSRYAHKLKMRTEVLSLTAQ